MRREPRAVLFDLDDTLYLQRRFLLSGFAAVARHLEAEQWIPARTGFAALVAALRRGARGRELQTCLQQFALAPELVDPLVGIIRTHTPALRLPRDSREVLDTLRGGGWRLGLVTNGDPSIQRRKIEALGLRRFVDVVICAAEYGSGAGKPEAEPFIAALTQLGVEPRRAIFVGDSEPCDVQGAAALGLWTIRLDRMAKTAVPSIAVATLRSIREVPTLAARLVGPAWSRDVA